MSPEFEKEKVATRAIIVVDGKVLLGKRGRGIGKGLFALVGGKPDGGETPEQAVIREVREETGLKLKNLFFWLEEANDKTVAGQTWHTYYFISEAEGEINLKKDEVPEVIYVGRDDLTNIEVAFNHKEILAKFFNEIGSD